MQNQTVIHSTEKQKVPSAALAFGTTAEAWRTAIRGANADTRVQARAYVQNRIIDLVCALHQSETPAVLPHWTRSVKN